MRYHLSDKNKGEINRVLHVPAQQACRAKVRQAVPEVQNVAQICQRRSVMADVARDFLCIPATSVPVERLFSNSGYIATDRRSLLKPKNVQMLTFLNMNYKFCID